MVLIPLGGWLLLILCWGGYGQAAEGPMTPREVVERWVQVYPGNMTQAAELTTVEFREGLSKREWIDTQGAHLRNLGMKYVRAKIAHEEQKKGEAHIIVHAHIKTVMGDHPQDELYILVRNSVGQWLVNTVEVYTESFNRTP